jgi:hypothetical protein
MVLIYGLLFVTKPTAVVSWHSISLVGTPRQQICDTHIGNLMLGALTLSILVYHLKKENTINLGERGFRASRVYSELKMRYGNT